MLLGARIKTLITPMQRSFKLSMNSLLLRWCANSALGFGDCLTLNQLHTLTFVTGSLCPMKEEGYLSSSVKRYIRDPIDSNNTGILKLFGVLLVSSLSAGN